MCSQNPLSEFHQRSLDEILSARSAHPELAAAAALDYCVENGVDAPRWAVEDAAKALRDLLARERPSVRGRAGSLLARYRQDQIDMERWDEVLTARWNQKRVAERVKDLARYPQVKRSRKHVEHELKLLDWLGHDWNRAYEVAAMHLLGRQAFAGPEAVKASYRKVQRTLRANGELGKYVRLHEEFLQKLGFEDIYHRDPGIKLFPIYNLTLPVSPRHPDTRRIAIVRMTTNEQEY